MFIMYVCIHVCDRNQAKTTHSSEISIRARHLKLFILKYAAISNPISN